MPLTRRQFDLGIDDDIESWMQQVYKLLSGKRGLAYSLGELRIEFLGRSEEELQSFEQDRFDYALEVLNCVGAIENRDVDGVSYYAFDGEFDTDSWESK